jgi:ABC-type amino acid transport substrate-binding protein
MEEFNDNTNKTKRSGYIYDLISLLEKRMGFNSTLIVAPIHASYDELVECVHNGTYEIVMADLTQTASRADKVDFSVSIYNNYLRLVVRKSKKVLVPWYAFVLPFHGHVWLVIGIMFSASVLLIFGYEKVNEKSRPDQNNCDVYDKSKLESFMKSFYHTIGAMVQRGSELQVKSFGGRGQTIILWLTSIYLVSLLTSSMTRYFIAQQEKPWIQSVDELKMCGNIDCNRIGVIEHSQHDDYLRTHLMDGNQMNYHYLKHTNECYSKLLNYYIDVAIADSSSAEYFTQKKQYCELEVVGFPFSKTDFAVALSKQWPYKQDLDNHIMKLKEEGEIDRLLAEYFQQKLCDSEDSDNDNGNGLRLSQVYGLFIVQASVTTAILVISVLKWRFSDRNRHRMSHSYEMSHTNLNCINSPVQLYHHQQGNPIQNCAGTIQTINSNSTIDVVVHAAGTYSQERMTRPRKNTSQRDEQCLTIISPEIDSTRF